MAMAETANVDSLDIQITATANKAIAALETLSKRLEKVSESLRATQAALEGQTKAQEAANQAEEKGAEETVKVARETDKMTASTKKAVSGLSKLARAFGRIMLYRAIRNIIKNIGSSIREGLTNLKEYSDAVGTAFSPAVDNLRKHVLLLKNAFATALRPVIEALIPVIIKIVDWLSKAADFIAQVMSVLTGKVDANGRYTKAVLSDLKQSNKQAKELRRTLLGFDEINRLDGGTPKNETAQSGGMMFTQADVSEKAKKWAEIIQKIIDKVKGIFKAIAEFIAKHPWVVDLAIGLLAAYKILKTFGGVLKPIFKLVEAIGLKGIAIIAIITAMAIWGDKIAAWLDKAADKVREFFNGLKSGQSVLADSVAGTLGDVFGLFLETIGLISSAVYKLFHGDFKGALEDAKQILKNVLKILAALVIGVINIILGVFSDMVNAIAKAWTWLHNEVWAPIVNGVATFLAKAKVWVNNALADIKIGFFLFLRMLLVAFDNAVQVAVGIINGMIDTFNTITGANLKPLEVNIDTTIFDEKIAEIEATKLPPITETVQVVGKWKEPSKLKLQIDTTGVYNAIDQIGQKVNKLGTAVSSVMSAIGGTANQSRPIVKYASGGFPSVGSLFIAGEAGPEIVANFNGQTGVYNTDQMEAALYRAVSSALANMPQQGGDIYLDGEIIYRNVVRRNNNHVRSTGRAALLT